jgi:hypothetical protein
LSYQRRQAWNARIQAVAVAEVFGFVRAHAASEGSPQPTIQQTRGSGVMRSIEGKQFEKVDPFTMHRLINGE